MKAVLATSAAVADGHEDATIVLNEAMRFEGHVCRPAAVSNADAEAKHAR